MKKKPPLSIRQLYPELNEKQLERAASNLERYAEIVSRIYQRIQSEAKELTLDPNGEGERQCLDLTGCGGSSTIRGERSIPTIN